MKNKGFTLLETIIYLGLFSVLMSGALIAVYTLLQSGTQNMNGTSIQAEGTFINRKLNWALPGATTVTVPNVHTIIITRPDLGTESPLTITELNGTFSIARGTNEPSIFTNLFLTVANTNINLIPEHGEVTPFIQMRYTINDIPFVFETYLKQ